MTIRSLRWTDPETAAALYDLRVLTPQLSRLIYCGPIPEAPSSTILDWSDAICAPDNAAAVERLREVFGAMVCAFIASHTYAPAERWDGGKDIVELFDTGGGATVCQALGLTALIAIALHGDEGRDLVVAARAKLAHELSRISEMMMGR